MNGLVFTLNKDLSVFTLDQGLFLALSQWHLACSCTASLKIHSLHICNGSAFSLFLRWDSFLALSQSAAWVLANFCTGSGLF